MTIVEKRYFGLRLNFVYVWESENYSKWTATFVWDFQTAIVIYLFLLLRSTLNCAVYTSGNAAKCRKGFKNSLAKWFVEKCHGAVETFYFQLTLVGHENNWTQYTDCLLAFHVETPLNNIFIVVVFPPVIYFVKYCFKITTDPKYPTLVTSVNNNIFEKKDFTTLKVHINLFG